jgi:hypothetical protein
MITITNILQSKMLRKKELRLGQGSKMQVCDVFELINDENRETYYYKLGESYNNGAGWVNEGFQHSLFL